MTPEKARQLINRLPEHGADIEQILAKLNEVYALAIESTEERINPKMDEPVEVKVRNLAVARGAAMDMYLIHKELVRVAEAPITLGGADGQEVRYELVKSWVDPDEDWTP